ESALHLVAMTLQSMFQEVRGSRCEVRTMNFCILTSHLELRTSQLRNNSIPAPFHLPPGDSLVRAVVDDEHEVVAVLQIAAQHVHLLEFDLEAMRRAGTQRLAEALEVGKEDALIGADDAKIVIVGIERPLGVHLYRLAFRVEEDRAE